MVDGDTVAIDPSFLPVPLNASPLSVRLRGIDCPESGHRAHCMSEYNLASAASLYTKQKIEEHTAANVGIELCSWDKYGGRILGDIVFWKEERTTHDTVVDGVCV